MVQSAERRPQTLLAAVRYFSNPEVAERFITRCKWPDGEPCCPECGSVNVGRIKSRNRYQCREKECRKQFSLLTGTIMEGTHLKLDQWLVATWLIVNCRNGVSSCEIARTIGCKQQSAWHLLHRVRHVLKPEREARVAEVAEADTTFVGGIIGNMPKARRAKAKNRHPHTGKTTVHAIRDRQTGRVRAQVIKRETSAKMRTVINRNVAKGARLYTDSAHTYAWAGREGFSHETVNHTAEEYVRGEVSVNGCENFFNCLRRGLKGTYIRPTPGHLQAYVDEAVYRFNVRTETEWDRFEGAMRQIVGKRLTYGKLTRGCVR